MFEDHSYAEYPDDETVPAIGPLAFHEEITPDFLNAKAVMYYSTPEIPEFVSALLFSFSATLADINALPVKS